MREIEILYKTEHTIEEIMDMFESLNFVKTRNVTDTYFFDPERDNLKLQPNSYPTQWFRLRATDNNSYVTYKTDVFKDEQWLYSEEHDTHVADPTAMRGIIDKLGFNELVVVHNVKQVFENENYEVLYEEVEDLGYFIEIERKNIKDDGRSVEEIKDEIRLFAQELKITGKEMHQGKPEMLIRKKYND